jgi:hypothetical protein
MSTTGKTGGDRAEMLPAYLKIVRGIGSNTLMLGKFGYESLQWKVLTSSYIGVVTFLLTQIEALVPDLFKGSVLNDEPDGSVNMHFLIWVTTSRIKSECHDWVDPTVSPSDRPQPVFTVAYVMYAGSSNR